MNKKTQEMLKYLKLDYLLAHWDEIMAKVESQNQSYDKFLLNIVTDIPEHSTDFLTAFFSQE